MNKIFYRMKGLIDGLNEIVKFHYKGSVALYSMDYSEGRRYYKILFCKYNGYYPISRQVLGFVDKTTGNVYESKTAERRGDKILTNVNLLSCGMEKVTYDGEKVNFLGM